MAAAYIVVAHHPSPVWATSLDVGSDPGRSWALYVHTTHYFPFSTCHSLDHTRNSQERCEAIKTYEVLKEYIPDLDGLIKDAKRRRLWPKERRKMVRWVRNTRIHPFIMTHSYYS
jgi:hypothetical protein